MSAIRRRQASCVWRTRSRYFIVNWDIRMRTKWHTNITDRANKRRRESAQTMRHKFGSVRYQFSTAKSKQQSFRRQYLTCYAERLWYGDCLIQWSVLQECDFVFYFIGNISHVTDLGPTPTSIFPVPAQGCQMVYNIDSDKDCLPAESIMRFPSQKGLSIGCRTGWRRKA